MAFLIVFVALVAVAVLGAWLGADSRPMDPRDPWHGPLGGTHR